MTTNAPLSPGGSKAGFKLPMPPPLLHTRSTDGVSERPSTPTTPRSGANAITSPYATPQGSPSKNAHPPGARELPNVFETAMRLEPPSPTKVPGSPTRTQLGVGSPNKSKPAAAAVSSPDATGILPPDIAKLPGSPLRGEANQENTPPGGTRLGKDYGGGSPAPAATARQEQYQPAWMSARLRSNPMQALTPEEVEKLSSGKVKRLANVTQICTLGNTTAIGMPLGVSQS